MKRLSFLLLLLLCFPVVYAELSGKLTKLKLEEPTVLIIARHRGE